MSVAKAGKYEALVQRRKTCYLCTSLCNPSKVEGYSQYDNEIGPWSRWQGNLDAKLMIVGQDWGNERLLRNNYLMEDGNEVRSNPTNKNLLYLLNSIFSTKIDWKLRGMGGKYFFTNAVLCLRDKNTQMQSKANPVWFNNCVGKKKFLRQQIEIVNPRVVVGLGALAFNSILRSFDLKPKKLREIVRDKKGIKLPNTRAKAFAVYHCGAAGWNINRTKREHLRDWKRIGDVLIK
jgi:uracil-DNA glycosylase family 4